MSGGLSSLFPGTKQRVEDRKRQKRKPQRKTQHYTFRTGEAYGWESVIQLLAPFFSGGPLGLLPSLFVLSRYPTLDLPAGSLLEVSGNKKLPSQWPASVFLLYVPLSPLHSFRL